MGSDLTPWSSGAPLLDTDRALLAAVARRYYLGDESKVAIAADLGLSRFKVARLLERARQEGVVRIEIADDSGLDTGQAQRLCTALGLRSAHVLAQTPAANENEVRDRLAQTGAAVLGERLGPDDVLGLPWSRTVARMVARLDSLPPVPVVQLSGALTLTDHDSAVDIVREAARISAGPAHHFYAPLVATDAASARMLLRQPSVADAMSHISDVTVAVVGVGAWSEHESTLYDLATEQERRELATAGAVGEVSGVFVDEKGSALKARMSHRVISAEADQLRAIPHVIALASGAARAAAVRAAVRGGLVDSVVVDFELAAALLQPTTQ